MRTPRSGRPTVAAVLPGVVIAAAVLAVYLPGALRNGFSIDDERFIVDNPFVTRPDGIAGWLRLLYDPTTTDPESAFGIVRPLRTLEFALDHALFALSPAAFHLHSLLWHAAAAVLAYVLLLRLRLPRVPALCGAALWALHPMHVEAVAWIASRGDVAMGACVLLALVLETYRGAHPRAGAAALTTGLLAMLFKETAVVLPLLVFALRLVRPRDDGPPGRIVPALRAAVPYAVLAALYLVFRGIVQVGPTSHMQGVMMGGDAEGTFSTMFRGLGVYVVQTLLPVRCDYDWYLPTTTSIFAPGTLSWLAIVAALVVTAVRLRARRPGVAAAICLFFFPLIPVANWPFQLGIPTAERFLYLPALGVALLAATAAHRRRGVAAACLVTAAAMGGIAHAETRDWRNVETTMASALRHGTSPRSFSFRAAARRERALSLLERAARTPAGAGADELRANARRLLEESLADSHRCLFRWERFERARHSTSDVVMEPHVNAANVALFLDRPGEALWHSDRAIAANESLLYQPHYNRAGALSAFGRHAEVVEAIARTLELGGPRDDERLLLELERAARHCAEAGALAAARRGYELLRDARPDAAARGLRGLPAAAQAAASRPPAERAVQLALVGAPVPAELLSAVADGPRRELVLGCAAERRGEDGRALAHLQRALAEGGLRPGLAERARRAVQRIEGGCPAWTDQSDGAASR